MSTTCTQRIEYAKENSEYISYVKYATRTTIARRYETLLFRFNSRSYLTISPLMASKTCSHLDSPTRQREGDV